MLTKNCCENHYMCNDYVQKCDINKIGNDNFNKFIRLMYPSKTYNCLLKKNVFSFVEEGTKLYLLYIENFIKILRVIKVAHYKVIYINQKKNNNDLNNLISTNSLYVNEIIENNELMQYIISNVETDKFILLYKNIKQTNYFRQYKNNLLTIVSNKLDEFKKIQDCYILADFIMTSEYNISYIDNFFPIINNTEVSQIIIIDVLKKNKTTLLINLFTKYNIKITTEIIEKWVSYSSHLTMSNADITEIMEIFFTFGFVITKEILIILLKKRYHFKNINKFNIPIDNDILQISIVYNCYNCYDIECIPSEETLKTACFVNYHITPDYINFLDKLKNAGGVFNVECLKLACLCSSREPIVNYLIKNCGIEPNKDCVKAFEETYHFKPLSLIIKNYNPNPIKKNENENPIIINSDVLTTINKKDIIIDTDKEYTIHKKIKTLLGLKEDIIKYCELEKLMLKYLIDNKLIIGTYFVIDTKLSSIISIDKSSMLHIDELKTFIPYLIKNYI